MSRKISRTKLINKGRSEISEVINKSLNRIQSWKHSVEKERIQRKTQKTKHSMTEEILELVEKRRQMLQHTSKTQNNAEKKVGIWNKI